MDDKLSIYFGEDKTTSILFASKSKKKDIKKLNIEYEDMQTKQIKHSEINYLRCLMDETISGKAMILEFRHIINNKLKFFYCKNDFLKIKLRPLFLMH